LRVWIHTLPENPGAVAWSRISQFAKHLQMSSGCAENHNKTEAGGQVQLPKEEQTEAGRGHNNFLALLEPGFAFRAVLLNLRFLPLYHTVVKSQHLNKS
jgi:hypothetical protein